MGGRLTICPRGAGCLALAVVWSLALGCSEEEPGPTGPDAGRDAAVQADGSAPDATAHKAPLSDDALINACARTSACGIVSYPAMGYCVDAYYKLYRPQGISSVYDSVYRCVNAAGGDCESMAKCFGRRGTCDNKYKATCEGSLAVGCDLLDKKVYAFDCGQAKMGCGIMDNQTVAASCTPGACTSSYKPRCDGDRLLICTAGIIEVQDCLALSKFCHQTADKGPVCRGNRRRSCDKFTPSCLKNVAVTCVQGKEHWTDCDQLALMTSLCKAGACVAAKNDCDHAMNRCSGDKLEVCLNGSRRAIDCKTLGLGVCKSAKYGANCTPPKQQKPAP